MPGKLRKLLPVILGVVLFAGVGYATYRIVMVNRNYPAPATYIYDMGQEIQGGTLSLVATRTRLIGAAELKTIAPDYQDRVGAEGQSKVLLVDLEITNSSADQAAVSLVGISAQSRAWSNDAELDLLIDLNDRFQNGQLLLDPQSTTTARLAYSLYDFQFATKDEWAQVGRRPFELVLSLYPNKNIALLNLED